MIIFPDSIYEIFFGNGSFGRNGVSIESDIGYIRLIHGFGIFGLLGLLFYLLPIRKIIIYFVSSNINHYYKKFAISLFLIVLFGLIANIKLIYISSRIYVFILFIYISIVNKIKNLDVQ
jgi:hypothetical protein